MSKRISAHAQKEQERITGTPVKGIDVVVLKNPGNSASRTGTTNEKGEVEFVGLEPGSYSLTIVDPSKQQKVKGSVTGDVLLRNYLIEIIGLPGGPLRREWNAEERKFVKPSNATARATTAPSYEDKINFDIDYPVPVCTFIIKSKSNISSN